MKSLGRIALEAYETAWGREPVEHDADFICHGFDAAAQAVRQAVLEEAADICSDQSLDAALQDATYHMGAMDCAHRIRALKRRQTVR